MHQLSRRPLGSAFVLAPLAGIAVVAACHSDDKQPVVMPMNSASWKLVRRG